jgi:hypothetical protein
MSEKATTDKRMTQMISLFVSRSRLISFIREYLWFLDPTVHQEVTPRGGGDFGPSQAKKQLSIQQLAQPSTC